MRKLFLTSKAYICERCEDVGNIAHHKIYLNEDNINDPYTSLGFDNLECLCPNCHNKEHHKGERKVCYTFDKDGNIVYSPRITHDI